MHGAEAFHHLQERSVSPMAIVYGGGALGEAMLQMQHTAPARLGMRVRGAGAHRSPQDSRGLRDRAGWARSVLPGTLARRGGRCGRRCLGRQLLQPDEVIRTHAEGEGQLT